MPDARPPSAAADDAALVAALRRRDERAFAALVDRYHGSLHRLARLYVRDAGSAEDVVQETWLGVLRGLDGFEGRAAFKTWLFRILVNRAKTRAVRDGRTVPFSQLTGGSEMDDPGEPAVPAERFRGPDDPYPGHWRAGAQPRSWGEDPESALLAAEAQALIQTEIARLPPAQRAVITLRDVEGWAAAEVCNILEISETNQRVLLHRARARVRRALERYFHPE
jgi:RNA polymerase sigma-70 factor (ECF subfamily)